jgi:hypothetical protein
MGFGGSDIWRDGAGILREFVPDGEEGRFGEIGGERSTRGGAEDWESEVDSNFGLGPVCQSVSSKRSSLFFKEPTRTCQRTYHGH